MYRAAVYRNVNHIGSQVSSPLKIFLVMSLRLRLVKLYTICVKLHEILCSAVHCLSKCEPIAKQPVRKRTKAIFSSL